MSIKSATMTAEVMRSYLSTHAIPSEDLPKLAGEVHALLHDLSSAGPTASSAKDRPKPAVAIEKSIQAGCLVCLEDGLRFKSLKRHLRSRHGLSPQAYREKWNLPDSYPMSAFRHFGIFMRPGKAEEVTVVVVEEEPLGSAGEASN